MTGQQCSLERSDLPIDCIARKRSNLMRCRFQLSLQWGNSPSAIRYSLANVLDICGGTDALFMAGFMRGPDA